MHRAELGLLLLLACSMVCDVVYAELAGNGNVNVNINVKNNRSRKRGVGIYYDNGFDQTVALANLKRRDRQRIQNNVLSVLGFTEAPKLQLHAPTYSERHESNLQFLVDAYHKLQNLDARGKRSMKSAGRLWRDLMRADAVFSVRALFQTVNATLEGEKQQVSAMVFDVSNLTIGLEQVLKSAILRVFMRPVNNSEEATAFTVYKVLASNVLEPILLHEPTAASGWMDFDVTRTLNGYRSNASQPVGIVVTAHLRNGTEVDAEQVGMVTRLSNAMERNVSPFLLLFAHEATGLAAERIKLDRRRRNAESQQIAEQSTAPPRAAYNARVPPLNSCKMRHLHVNFRKLGWSKWIVAPDGYDANYCTGACNAHNQNTATNHAIVQMLLHVMYRQVYPLPSCAPLELDDTSILYRDANGYVALKKYRQMVAKSCSCQ